MIQKAFYTYRFSDEEFEKQIQQMMKLHSVLQGRVYMKEKLEEFEKDPFDMSEKEFDELYDKLEKKYSSMQAASIDIRSFLPQEDEEEDKDDLPIEPAEKLEDEADAILVSESYSSIDRKMKEEKKKPAKSLGSAEYVKSESAPSSQAAVDVQIENVAKVEEKKELVEAAKEEVKKEEIKKEVQPVIEAESAESVVIAAPVQKKEENAEEKKDIEAVPVEQKKVEEPKKEEKAVEEPKKVEEVQAEVKKEEVSKMPAETSAEVSAEVKKENKSNA